MTDALIMWVIYDHPLDFPDGFIARLWQGATATDRVVTGETLGAVRGKLRTLHPDLVSFHRSERDDPRIVEVWL